MKVSGLPSGIYGCWGEEVMHENYHLNAKTFSSIWFEKNHSNRLLNHKNRKVMVSFLHHFNKPVWLRNKKAAAG